MYRERERIEEKETREYISHKMAGFRRAIFQFGNIDGICITDDICITDLLINK